MRVRSIRLVIPQIKTMKYRYQMPYEDMNNGRTLPRRSFQHKFRSIEAITVRFWPILLKKPTGNILVVRLLLLQYAIRLTQDNKHPTKSVNISVNIEPIKSLPAALFSVVIAATGCCSTTFSTQSARSRPSTGGR